MANPSPPDPDVVAEAYRLTQPEPEGEGMTLAQVALRLGISKATAGNYVQKAIAHMPMVAIQRRARQQGDMAQRMVAVLYEAYEMAAQRRPSDPDDDPTAWLTLLDFAAKREAQLATLLGLNAATKLIVSHDGNGATGEYRDKSTIEALMRMQDRNRRDDQAIRAGRPGVIEGGN